MATPTDAPCMSDETTRLFKALITLTIIPYTSVAVPLISNSASSPLMRVARNPGLTGMMDGTQNMPMSYNLTKELYDCYNNQDSSNPQGDDDFFCQPGEHMTSDDDPCPGSQLCCQCKPGTFLPKENTCGTCIPHTECDEIEISGDGLSDNVCVKAQSEDVTTDPSELIHPPDAGTEPEEVDTGQNVATDSPLIHPPDTGTKQEEADTGQDEQNSDSAKFSIPWPWSLICVIVMIVLIAMIVIMIALKVFRFIQHMKAGDSKSYELANKDDVEMCPIQIPKSRGDRGTKVQREN